MDQRQSQYKPYGRGPRRATWSSQKYPIWIPENFETVKHPEEPYDYLLDLMTVWFGVFLGFDDEKSTELFVHWYSQNISPSTKLNFWNPPSRINPNW